MKKIGSLVNENIINTVKDYLKDSEAAVFIGFNKMSAFAFNKVRNNLHGVGAKVLVVKNSLLKKVFEEIGLGSLDGFLEKETGIVFSYDKDIVKVCKALVDFSKENENLKFKGGFLKEYKFTAEKLEKIAEMPSKEILLSMTISGIVSPLTGFLSTLNQIVLKFVWAVEEIKKTKDK